MAQGTSHGFSRALAACLVAVALGGASSVVTAQSAGAAERPANSASVAKSERQTVRAAVKYVRAGKLARAKTVANKAAIRTIAQHGVSVRLDHVRCVKVAGDGYLTAVLADSKIKASRGCFATLSWSLSGQSFRAESTYFFPVKKKAGKPFLRGPVLIAG